MKTNFSDSLGHEKNVGKSVPLYLSARAPLRLCASAPVGLVPGEAVFDTIYVVVAESPMDHVGRLGLRRELAAVHGSASAAIHCEEK